MLYAKEKKHRMLTALYTQCGFHTNGTAPTLYPCSVRCIIALQARMTQHIACSYCLILRKVFGIPEDQGLYLAYP